MYSFALSGLSFVNALVPGVTPPSVVFRAFGAFSSDSNTSLVVAIHRGLTPPSVVFRLFETLPSKQ